MPAITIFKDGNDAVIVLHEYIKENPNALRNLYERLGSLIDTAINKVEDVAAEPEESAPYRLKYPEVKFTQGPFKGKTPEEVIKEDDSVALLGRFAAMLEQGCVSDDERRAVSRAIQEHLPKHVTEQYLESASSYSDSQCNWLLRVAKYALSEEALRNVMDAAGVAEYADLPYRNIVEKRMAARAVIEMLLHLKNTQDGAGEKMGKANAYNYPDANQFAKGEAVDINH